MPSFPVLRQAPARLTVLRRPFRVHGIAAFLLAIASLVPLAKPSSAQPLAMVGLGLVPAGDFSVTMNNNELGASNRFSSAATITITPVDGFSLPVSFECDDLPAGASCAFSPTTVAPNGAPAKDTLTVSYSNTAASLHHAPSPFVPAGIAACTLLCCIGLRKRPLLLMAVLAVITIGFTTACGSPNQSLKTYSVTLSAYSGSLRHNVSFHLTVE